MTAYTEHKSRRLGLLDKARFLLAVGAAMLLFLSVGRMATTPVDPLGAISLLTHGRAPLMLLEVAALAMVIAALATPLVGSKLPDVGVFAAGLGLGLASLRGNTATHLLMTSTSDDGSNGQVLAGKLMIECLIWFAVIFAAIVVSGIVMRWCLPAVDGDNPDAFDTTRRMSISECPGLSGRVVSSSGETTSVVAGIRLTVVTAVIAAIAFAVLASGTRPISIEHGQVCFAVFAAFYLGVWIARSFFDMRTPFWGLMAIPLACLLSGLWSLTWGRGSGTYQHLATVPASDFLRILPMTYVGTACVGVITAHWTTGSADHQQGKR